MISRASLIAQLGSRRFDLLIIGGGIVGAGIARDATMRGLKIALVEQGDFASGASSKTSKLIHGGLRYLEHGHLRLVFESLRERAILRTIAPSLVSPLALMLPMYQDDRRRAWKIHLGLWLYDCFALGHPIRFHQMLSARRALEREPRLRADGLRAAGVYTDCQMDDARLCLANVLQAVNLGAVCCNYVRLRALLSADQRLCGGVVEEVFTGRTFEVRAKAVVNATGPWSDHVRQLSVAGARPRLAPSKGVHLIVPRLAKEALFVQRRADGRMLFLLPWGDYSLVGTTETVVGNSLDALSATADEVDDLLREVNRIVPGSHLDETDVVATYAGARPLLESSSSSTSASREHRIEVDRWGLVSILGGKFTTYRLMAKQVVDLLVTRNNWHADRCLTDQVTLLETTHPRILDHWQELIRRIDPDLLARLLVRYGAGTVQILEWISRDPTLIHPICPHHDYCQAELVYALQGELACTLTDVLARRTRIAWSSCQGLDALSTVTDLFQRYAGPSCVDLEQQLERYHQFLCASLAFRRLPLSSQPMLPS